MGKIIRFYKTPDGACPVQAFLDALPGKAAQKVTWVLRLIEDLDIVPSTYFRKLTDTKEIWGCRIQRGSIIYRIFGFLDGRPVLVLTHGVVKKTQRTPSEEIERAERYRYDYLQRRQHP